MRAEFLDFSPPCVGEDEIRAVVETLQSPWITTGPRTRRLEEAFTRFIGAPAALALNSCTAALHTALATLGVGPGDEVITTPMTFAASVNVVEHVGAKPVLVDVEPDTLNISPAAVERAIGKKTKVVLPVHFGGHPADLDALRDLASANGAIVLEDAAHAVPAKYKGTTIGSGDNPVAFSFYATKNMTTAEGGMLTGASELVDRARIMSLHGMSRDAWKRYSKEGSWFYEVVVPGFKYNMTDIAAAIGLVQLEKLCKMQQRRREVVERYNEAFGQVDALELPVERPEVEHAWHLYALRLRLDRLIIDRAQFITELTARNIGTSVHFIPVHLHPYYRDKYGFEAGQFPVAFDAYHRLVSLPLHPGLNASDVDDVIEAVTDVAQKFAR